MKVGDTPCVVTRYFPVRYALLTKLRACVTERLTGNWSLVDELDQRLLLSPRLGFKHAVVSYLGRRRRV